MESRPEPTENVPVWFHRYAIENERQHASLNERIASVETRMAELETRLVRWVVGSVGVAAGLVVALNRLLES